MKDLSYFLNSEKIYNETPIPEMIYIEGIGYEFLEEPLHFLRRKPFERLIGMATKKDGKNGLSAVEWLILFTFLGHFSNYFRNDNYHGEIPEVVVEMQNVLDSVIKKAPKFIGNRLFRFLKPHDRINFRINEIYQPSHSITTTTENWELGSDMYIITPLGYDKTKAHSLFEFCNHGNETQVNFERGTCFKVTNIVKKIIGY